ncbi:hypothetical protein mRhiFer1_009092 [Rhinolophus ferrumequinum]|uniref:Uncharacterized protein n=1 Tax=Rhinolophus ferrumequinum TaxID=59479 RepID=A0A7J7SYA2_RHIFE|nr:hypothetical protein mRhiFer1_009092 [Rhinolophus ferrumequinum]
MPSIRGKIADRQGLLRRNGRVGLEVEVGGLLLSPPESSFSHLAVTCKSYLVLSVLRLLSQYPWKYHPQKFAPSSLLRISRHLVEEGLLTFTPTEGWFASSPSPPRYALQPPKLIPSCLWLP